MSKAVPASPVPGAKNTSAKPSNSNKGPRWCRWIGLFAVPVLVTALSYTSAPLFHWLRQCIDPYPHASGGAAGTFYAYPHPWHNNGTRDCFDTRLTRLTRWLFAREFAPEIHNDRNRFVIDGLLSEEECARLISYGTDYSGGYSTGARVSHDPVTGAYIPIETGYYHNSSEFRGNKVALMIRESREAGDRNASQFMARIARRVVSILRGQFSDPCIWIEHMDAARRCPRHPPEGARERWALRLSGGHPMHSDAGTWGGDPWTMAPWAHEQAADNYRNFSGVLYLNDQFEGGEHYQLDADRWVPWAGSAVHFLFSYLYVRPACGRLAAFRSYHRPTEAHGTFATEKGSRYTWGMWFTSTRSRRSHALESQIDIELGEEQGSVCDKTELPPPRKDTRSPEVKLHCGGLDCFDPTRPLLEYVSSTQTCECQRHPCHGLMCPNPGHSFLALLPANVDGTYIRPSRAGTVSNLPERCRCIPPPCEEYSCASLSGDVNEYKLREDIFGNCFCGLDHSGSADSVGRKALGPPTATARLQQQGRAEESAHHVPSAQQQPLSQVQPHPAAPHPGTDGDEDVRPRKAQRRWTLWDSSYGPAGRKRYKDTATGTFWLEDQFGLYSKHTTDESPRS